MSKKRKSSSIEILHRCQVCGNQWEAKFPVKHCFSCGYDERSPGALKAIERIKIKPITASNGKQYIPLKLKKVKGKYND